MLLLLRLGMDRRYRVFVLLLLALQELQDGSLCSGYPVWVRQADLYFFTAL